jgi:hypothetical protein
MGWRSDERVRISYIHTTHAWLGHSNQGVKGRIVGYGNKGIFSPFRS